MSQRSHYDVAIIGAGLSGIGAAYYLQDRCPHKHFTVFEARERMGGTWDLFRYPGVRSDSDMYTLGFSFHPWDTPEAIAEGPKIRQYIEDTARTYGIDRKIQFGQRVVRSAWSSDAAQWSLDIQDAASGEVRQVSCDFLIACSGYYRYDAGYTPDFEGIEGFGGQLIHPQFWPEDLDYRGKRVVVIGSGATAVTLVPSMAERAGHVTMLQRSPTYMFNAPSQDPQEAWLMRNLPTGLAYNLCRWRRIALSTFFVQASLRYPEKIKRWLLEQVADSLGPDGDLDAFTPDYNPWKQRMCLVPDGDLFRAIKSGKASVVTDHIECFTEKGLRLRSGKELEADIVITATGLQVELFSGNALEIDGKMVRPSDCLAYRAMMLSGVPNLAFCVGYTRGGSWTLKVDIVCQYTCRLLNYMERHGYTTCMPHFDPTMEEAPLVDFESGYIQRALAHLPRAGARYPWRVFENYFLDRATLGMTPLDDGILQFSKVDAMTLSQARFAASSP